MSLSPGITLENDKCADIRADAASADGRAVRRNLYGVENFRISGVVAQTADGDYLAAAAAASLATRALFRRRSFSTEAFDPRVSL